MRTLLALAAVPALLAGCMPHRDGYYRNVTTMPHEWDLAGPGYELRVYGPIPLEDVKGFIRDMEDSGWEVIGIEKASLPEEVMVDNTELDRPAKAKRPGPWRFDIAKTMDSTFVEPKPKWRLPEGEWVRSIPPYLEEGVRRHRQKYLVTMRAWD